MSNLDRAIFRVTHSLRRRAAGEHAVSTNELLEAFASEWMLDSASVAALYRAAVEQERQTRAMRRKT